MVSIQTLAQQHKARILKREHAARTHLTSDYHALWSSILKELKRLTDEMEKSWQEGMPLPPTWIYEQNRLSRLLVAVQGDVSEFAREAEAYVRAQLSYATTAGQEDALLLLEHELGSVRGVFGVPSEDALHILAQRGVADLRVRRFFQRLPQQAVDMMRKRLLAGLALGQGPREVAASLRRALGMPLNDALRLARTEMMVSYRQAALNTYRANADVVQGWEWLASPGACAFCEGMNGTKHDLSEGLESHPNCRCTSLPLTRSFEDILAA